MMEYYSVVKSGIENHTTVDTANVDGSQTHDTDQNSQLPNRAFHLIPLHRNCCDRKGLLGLWAEEIRKGHRECGGRGGNAQGRPYPNPFNCTLKIDSVDRFSMNPS